MGKPSRPFCRTFPMAAALLAVSLGMAYEPSHAHAPALAQAGSPGNDARAGVNADVTPEVRAPEVADLLTQAFANAAQAIRPSVVRIDVELAGRRERLARGRDSAARLEAAKDLERIERSLGRIAELEADPPCGTELCAALRAAGAGEAVA